MCSLYLPLQQLNLQDLFLCSHSAGPLPPPDLIWPVGVVIKQKGKCLIAWAHPLEWVQIKSSLRKVRGLPGCEENAVLEGRKKSSHGRMQKCPRGSAGQSSEETLPNEPSLKIYCYSHSWEEDPEGRCSALTSFTGSLQGWDSLAGPGERAQPATWGQRTSSVFLKRPPSEQHVWWLGTDVSKQSNYYAGRMFPVCPDTSIPTVPRLPRRHLHPPPGEDPQLRGGLIAVCPLPSRLGPNLLPWDPKPSFIVRNCIQAISAVAACPAGEMLSFTL